MARVISGGAWRNYNAAKELEKILGEEGIQWAVNWREYMIASCYIRKHFSV